MSIQLDSLINCTVCNYNFQLPLFSIDICKTHNIKSLNMLASFSHCGPIIKVESGFLNLDSECARDVAHADKYIRFKYDFSSWIEDTVDKYKVHFNIFHNERKIIHSDVKLKNGFSWTREGLIFDPRLPISTFEKLSSQDEVKN
jgi:hypothetical protein